MIHTRGYDLKAELLYLKHLCNLVKRLFHLFHLLLHPLCIHLLLLLVEPPCSQNARLKENSSDNQSIIQSSKKTDFSSSSINKFVPR